MWSGWIQRTQTWTIICHGLHYWLITPGANGKFNFGNLALSTNGLLALGLSAILAPFCDTLRLTDGFRAVLLGTVIGCFPNMKDLSCWLSKNGWFQWWKGWWMETELMSFVVIFFCMTEIGKCDTTLLSIDLLSFFAPICLMVTRVPWNANSAGHLGLCHVLLALVQAAGDGCLWVAVSDTRLGPIIA